MPFDFRPAVRDQVATLIALAGPSGCGKTLTALKLARGIVGGDDSRIFVADSEARRALHYACAQGEEPGPFRFRFMHGDLMPPFTPERFLEAARTAAQKGAQAIVFDSASLEYEGEGGLQDIHDEILTRRTKGDDSRREAMSAACWNEPKTRHKKMMNGLLQIRAHLIFCLRAEEKIRFVKVKDEKSGREKTAIESAGWVPICEKRFMYEMTASFLLTPDRPGFPQPIKLQEQHRAAFPLDRQIDERAGEALAVWARGGQPPRPEPESSPPPATAPEKPAAAASAATSPFVVPTGPKTRKTVETAAAWRKDILDLLAKTGVEHVQSFNDAVAPILDEVSRVAPEEGREVAAAFERRLAEI